MYKTVQVAVEKTAFHFDKLFSYLLPERLYGAQPGKRVLVPFGTGNARRQGMIFSVGETDEPEKLKRVLDLLDETPVLSEAQLALAEYVAENNYCTLYEAVRVMLPPGIGYEIRFRYVLDGGAPS